MQFIKFCNCEYKKKSRFYEFFLEEKIFRTSIYINNLILDIECLYININVFIFYIIKREFYFLNISNPMTYNVFYLYYLKEYKRTNVHVLIHLYVRFCGALPY